VCNITNGVFSQPTEKMLEAGTAVCFSAIEQNTLGRRKLKAMSFAGYIQQFIINRREYAEKIYTAGK